RCELRRCVGRTLLLTTPCVFVVASRSRQTALARYGRSDLFPSPPPPRSPGSGSVLRLAIDDTAWTDAKRQWTPLVPDHGHLMHLFLVRDSSLDGFAHLHPLPLDSTTFEAALPPLAAGGYRVYADVVHESGFAE